MTYQFSQLDYGKIYNLSLDQFKVVFFAEMKGIPFFLQCELLCVSDFALPWGEHRFNWFQNSSSEKDAGVFPLQHEMPIRSSLIANAATVVAYTRVRRWCEIVQYCFSDIRPAASRKLWNLPDLPLRIYIYRCIYNTALRGPFCLRDSLWDAAEEA